MWSQYAQNTTSNVHAHTTISYTWVYWRVLYSTVPSRICTLSKAWKSGLCKYTKYAIKWEELWKLIKAKKCSGKINDITGSKTQVEVNVNLQNLLSTHKSIREGLLIGAISHPVQNSQASLLVPGQNLHRSSSGDRAMPGVESEMMVCIALW